jgi:XTP/dITP diphosphohydrolase
MDIILATRNPSKAEQIREVFRGSEIKVLTLADVSIEGDAIEDGETLEDNALKKAMFAHNHAPAGIWTMADDTGIFINTLNGLPGVRSARWAGETATTEEIMQYTLNHLKEFANRSATFRTVVALVAPDGKKYFFEGEVVGHLLEAPRVSPQPKMPYSPLFVPDGSNKTWAEMSVNEENAISHRGKAFRKVRAFLEKV